MINKISGTNAQSLTTNVQGFAANSNAFIGLATFTDLPDGYFFKLVSPLSGTPSDYWNATSQLATTTLGGTDPKDAQLDAIIQATTSTQVGWRSNSFKVVVCITDSGFNEGAPYSTKADLIATLKQYNVVPIFITTQASGSIYSTLKTNIGFGQQINSGTDWTNAHVNLKTALTNTLKTVITTVSEDLKGFVVSGTTGYSAAVTSTTTTSELISTYVRLKFPTAQTGLITDVPRVIVNTVGYSQQTITTTVNRSPIPFPCIVTTNEDTPIDFPLTGVDPDGNLMRLRLQTLPKIGTLIQSNAVNAPTLKINTLYPWPDGNPVPFVRYTPSANLFGSDWFQYHIFDGCATSINVNCTITVNSVNDPPVADTISVQTLENVPLPIELTGTDIEDPADSLKARIVTLPRETDGKLLYPNLTPIAVGDIIADRQVVFKPTDYKSEFVASFTFQVQDTQGEKSQVATASIYVISVKQAPVARADSPVIAERTIPLTITLNSFDPDPEETQTYNITSMTTGTGTFTRPLEGTVINLASPVVGTSGTNANYASSITLLYTPAITSTVTTNLARFTFIVADRDNMLSQNVTVQIDLKPNNAPTATPTSITTLQDSTSSPVTLTGTDPDVYDIPTQKTIIQSLPSIGTLVYNGNDITQAPITLNNGKQVSYRTNNRGTDSFTFYVQDPVGVSSSTITVPITITPVNHQPIGSIGSLVTAEDTELLIGSISASDSDNDPVVIYISAIPNSAFGTFRQNSNGAIITSSDLPALLVDGKLRYMPPQDQNGSPYTNFTFYVDDQQNKPNSKSVPVFAYITVTPVNDPPVAISKTVNLLEGDPATSIVLDATDIDTADNKLSGVIVSLPAQYGVLTDTNGVSLTAGQNVSTARTVKFVPAQYSYGITSFTFRAYDGELLSTNVGVVTLNITHVNHDPTASATSPVTATRTIALPITLTANDVDIGDTLSFTIVTYNAAGGKFTSDSAGNNLFGTAGFVLTSLPNPTRTSVQTTVYYTAPNNAVNPSTGFYASLSFRVSDQYGKQSSLVTVGVNIKANNPPTANPSSIVVVQDSYQSTTLTGNDVDEADATSLRIEIRTLPSVGQLSYNGSPVTLNQILPTSNTTVTYFTSQRGTDIYFSFRVIDNTNAVSAPDTSVPITIIPVNHQPVASTPSVTTPEDTEIVIGSRIVMSDPDGDALTVWLASLPEGKGTFRQNSNNAIIDVPLTQAVRLIDGKFKFLPAQDQNGIPFCSYTFFVNDGQNDAKSNSTIATGVINVTAVNDAPIAQPTTFRTDEQSVVTPVPFTMNATDIDTSLNLVSIYINSLPSSSLGVLKTLDNNVIVVGQLIAYPWNITFTPVQYKYGTTSFTIKAYDSEAYSVATATVTIIVDSVPNKPVCSNITTVATRGQTIDLDISVFDPDVTDSHTFTIISWYLNQTSLQTSDGISIDDVPATLEVVPPTGTYYAESTAKLVTNATSAGTSSFKFKVNDGTFDSDECYVSIDILANNAPPTAFPAGPLTTLEEVPTSAVVLNGTDADDADRDELKVYITELPTNGRLKISDTNTFVTTRNHREDAGVAVVYVPNDLFHGSDSFTFLVRDPLGASSQRRQVLINVTHVNHPPTASWLNNVTTPEDTSVTITQMIASDIDINPPDVVSIFISTRPSKGKLQQCGTNVDIIADDTKLDSFCAIFVPPLNDNEPAGVYTTFTFYADDGTQTGNSRSATITGNIFVTPVNDPPVAVSSSISLFEGDSGTTAWLNATDVDSDQEDIIATILSLPDPTLGYLTDNAGTKLNAGVDVSYPRSIKFVPAQYSYGLSSFTFRVRDDAGASSADVGTVSINVTHVNHPPVAFSNTPLVATRTIPVPIVLIANDVDLIDSFSFIIKDLQPGQGGKFQDVSGNIYTQTTPFVIASNINNTASRSNSFTLHYVAPDNAATSPFASLRFAVSDGSEESAEANVTIDIAPNNPPVANPAGPISVFQDGQSEVISLNGTDIDVADTPLEVLIYALPTKGTLTSNGRVLDASDVGKVLILANVTYATTQRGTDQFSFVVRDHVNATSSPREVDINIINVNHPPTGRFDGATTNEDTEVVISTISVFDVDNDQNLNVIISALPDKGTLSQYDGTPLTVGAVVNDTLLRIRYLPLPNENQPDGPYTKFSFYVTDNQSENNRSVIIDANIYVIPVNDAPHAYPGNISLEENDPPVTFTFSVDDIDTPLANISVIILSLPDPNLGVLTKYGNGTLVDAGDFIADPRNLTFSPVLYASGTTTFLFSAYDGYLTSPEQASFTIYIASVNQKPVASSRSPLTATRLQSLEIVLNVEDPDIPEYFDFEVTHVHVNSIGGTFTDANGVAFPNTLPFVVAKNVSKAVLAATSVSVFFTAPDTAVGANYAKLSFQVYDAAHGVSNHVNVSINIALGSPPDASPAGPIILDEETTSGLYNLNGTDIDEADNTSLSIVILTLPSKGVLVINGTDITVTGVTFDTFVDVSVRGNPVTYGEDQFSFKVVDNVGLSSPVQVVDVIINHVNHRPTAYAVVGTSREDVNLEFTVEGADVDKQDKFVRYVTVLPTVGTLLRSDNTVIANATSSTPVPLTDNKLIYVPPPRTNGAPLAFIKFYVDDNAGAINSQSEIVQVDLVITPVDREPVAYSQNLTMNQDTRLRIQLNATDPQGYAMTYTITAFPPSDSRAKTAQLFQSDGVTEITVPSPTVGSDGIIYFVPPVGSTDQIRSPYATLSFIATGNSSNLNSAPANIIINVIKVNDPPTSSPQNQTVKQGDRVKFNINTASQQFTDKTLLNVFVVNTTKKNVITTAQGTNVDDNTLLVPDAQSQYVTFSYAPPADVEGIAYDSLSYYVVDPNGEKSEIYTIWIDVTHKYKYPVLTTVSLTSQNVTTEWNRADITFGIKRDTDLVLTWRVTDEDTPADKLRVLLGNPAERGTFYYVTGVAENGTYIFGSSILTSNSRITPNDDGLYRLGFVPVPGRFRHKYAQVSIVAIDDTPPIEGGPYITPRQNLIVDVLAINRPPVVVLPKDDKNVTITSYTTSLGAPLVIKDVEVGDPDAKITRDILKVTLTSYLLTEDGSTSKKVNLELPNSNDEICSPTTDGAITCYATITVFNSTVLSTIRFSDVGVAGNYVINILVNDMGVGAETGEEAANELTDEKNITVSVTTAAVVTATTKNNDSVLTAVIASSAAAGVGAAIGAWRIIKRRAPPTADFFGKSDLADGFIEENPLYEQGGSGNFENLLYEPANA